jgi:hypothetical protein
MTNPLIQIGDELREMTDEEYEEYKAIMEGFQSPYPASQPAGA